MTIRACSLSNMDCRILLLSLTLALTSAWSVPFYPVRGPPRHTRHALAHPHFHIPPHRVPGPGPAPVHETEDTEDRQRPKRDHDFDIDHHYDRGHRDHDHGHRDHDHHGVAGPVHTFVKTDKNANYKWGVRHHVGNKYAP